jgi:Flp pilus assembly protein TadG
MGIQMFRRFSNDAKGNFATTFAMVMVPIFMVLGLTVDMTRAYMYKGDLQNAVDSATLAAAIAGDVAVTDSERTKIGNSFFQTNYDKIPATISFQYPGDGTVIGTGAYKMPVLFGGFFGKDQVEVEVQAVVGIPSEGNLDLVMALDYSGSMRSNGKYQAMRDAAIDLLDELDKSNSNGNIRAGLVPFSEYVLTDINSSHIRVVHEDKYNMTAQACIGSRFAPFAINGSIPDQTNEDSKFPTIGLNDYWKKKGNDDAGMTDQVCFLDTKKDELQCEVCSMNVSADMSTVEDPWTDKDVFKDWKKANTDKCKKLDKIKNASMRDKQDANNEKASSAYPVDDPQCQAYVDNNLLATQLSSDFSAMKNQLGIARPVQLTNISLSLDAAWYQFKNATIGPDKQRFLVLLTDGVQTVPGYRISGRSDNAKYTINDAEKNTEDLCENIKDDGISIITIAFQLNDQPTRNRLRGCASSPSYFFEAESNSDLASVFHEITNLTKQAIYLKR